MAVTARPSSHLGPPEKSAMETQKHPLSPPCIPPKFVLHGLSSKSKFLAVEGSKHGFFNQGKKSGKYQETLKAAEEFLVSLSYLSMK